jgi:hypothetical protein
MTVTGTCAADGGAEEVHPRDPDVLGERVVVPPDEPDEFANVVCKGALGLALLDFHACRVERHSEIAQGRSAQKGALSEDSYKGARGL